MADKKLESITFPDLPDRYVVKPDIADVTGLQTALDDKADAEDVYNGFVSETLQGSIASFDDGADDIPVKSLIAEIVPVQSGSGDPSPDNVRPITGWTEAKIHVADGESPHIVDNVTTINWQSQAGTVYGGSIDVTSGVLTVTHGFIDLSELLFNTSAPYKYCAFANAKPPLSNADVADILAEKYKTAARDYMTDNCISLTSAGYLYIRTTDTPSGHFCYELATPQTYQLTPTEVKTLLGNNNVWADTGDIDLTYRADLGLYLDKIINA